MILNDQRPTLTEAQERAIERGEQTHWARTEAPGPREQLLRDREAGDNYEDWLDRRWGE